MAISIEEVRHVATLARLELDDDEIAHFHGALNAILGHFTDLDGATLPAEWLDAAFSPTVTGETNVFRSDAPGATLAREAALANAARTKAGLFLVPMIIEE